MEVTVGCHQCDSALPLRPDAESAQIDRGRFFTVIVGEVLAKYLLLSQRVPL